MKGLRAALARRTCEYWWMRSSTEEGDKNDPRAGAPLL